MRALLATGLSLLLSACGISNPILKSEIVSYDDVIESATDKLLVLNILRARDQAPLHFMALPSLRQSIQQNNSLSLLGLTGPRNGSTQRSTATLGMSFQVAPSFDLTHVYTKEFITGMTSPIDPKYVKYWIDRGLDRRLVMLLFFSSAEITDKGGDVAKVVRVTNTPKESIEEIRERLATKKGSYCEGKSQFERYLSVVNKIKNFSARMNAAPKKLLGCLKYNSAEPAKFLQALAAAEQAKIKYRYVKESETYKLYSASEESRVLFCISDTEDKPAVSAMSAISGDRRTQTTDPASGCKDTEPAAAEDDKECRPSNPSDDAKKPAAGAAEKSEPTTKRRENGQYCTFFGDQDRGPLPKDLEIQFTIRSVGEMIHFLGDLLYYQDALIALKSDPALKDKFEAQDSTHRLNNPVTLGYCYEGTKPADIPGIADILFTLGDNSSNTRFTVPYRDRIYSVGNYQSGAGPDPKASALCNTALAYRKDHTLEVLSVVQALTNLHQSATEIRATPTVQVVP